MPPTAIIMNMFYTGLGIARSLGEQGIEVIGLTSQHGVYGNFTRYAKTVFCPDSRTQPEALLAHLVDMGQRLGSRAVLFPTRDDDVVFLDRFREELSSYFNLVVPPGPALHACLDKWETYLWAQRSGVPAPRCWMVEGFEDLRGILPEITYPCVLKPLASHHWKQARNWEIVGARKAIGISSQAELLAEYDTIAHAGKRVLLQEMIDGGDNCLLIAACYLDKDSNWVAGFNTQKLVQEPKLFGTGCIVQASNRPELFPPTLEILQAMGFTGVAEVEYKWDASMGKYQLIEINPRLWDQHRLGKCCGVDLAYIAYCDHAGLPKPSLARRASNHKWIAEDTFVTTAVRLLWRRDPRLRSLFHLARGKRIYAIWSPRDPLPSIAYAITQFVPRLIGAGLQALWAGLRRGSARPAVSAQESRSL